MSVATQTLLYALVAGLSPLTLLATMAVLGGGRGRLNGTAFGIGFLLAQATVLALAILVGAALTPDRERDHQALAAALGIVLGLGLLAFAWRSRRPSAPRESPEGSRTEALLARLGQVKPATAFSFGALLGIGGVKRLTVTLFAGTTIGTSGLDRPEKIGLGLLYVVIAAVFVWVPVSIYIVAGRRADALTARTKSWLTANQQRATAISSLVFGLLLIGHSLFLLA